jgi:hypothetical protein
MTGHLDGLFDHVDGSQVGIVLFTDGYRDDPKALIELAVIIVLDKPLYLIVQYGCLLPEKLRAIADGVVFHDGTNEGWRQASHEVMEMARKRGHLV